MKKKIAFISEHASPLATLGGVDNGGQNVYVAELPKQLVKMGYVVDIFTRKENAAAEEIINWLPGIRVIHVKAGPEITVIKEQLLSMMDEFAKNMLAFIKKENAGYELIHANFFMSAWVASTIKKILHIPYVVTFHALGLVRKIHQKEQDKFPPERIKIEQEIVKDADHIIAECPQDKEDLVQLYQACPEKITIIPCGFSSKEFYPLDKAKARSLLNLPQHEKIILQLGRMVPRKGVDNVIKAAAKIKKTYHPLRLVIVGGDSDQPDPLINPELARLHNLALEEKIESAVLFTGKKQRDVLKYYYAAADIFITTPWYEPFGITPLESMACGTVVIGSNVGGIKFTVEHGKTGLLVPPHDPWALAQNIELLFNDHKLLATLRMNALKRVNDLFTWKKVACSCHQLYESILLKTNKERKHRTVLNVENFKLILWKQPLYPTFNVNAINE